MNNKHNTIDTCQALLNVTSRLAVCGLSSVESWPTRLDNRSSVHTGAMGILVVNFVHKSLDHCTWDKNPIKKTNKLKKGIVKQHEIA